LRKQYGHRAPGSHLCKALRHPDSLVFRIWPSFKSPDGVRDIGADPKRYFHENWGIDVKEESISARNERRVEMTGKLTNLDESALGTRAGPTVPI
jgi:hypothetical protein